MPTKSSINQAIKNDIDIPISGISILPSPFFIYDFSFFFVFFLATGAFLINL